LFAQSPAAEVDDPNGFGNDLIGEYWSGEL
jgi:hypothetical protein